MAFSPNDQEVVDLFKTNLKEAFKLTLLGSIKSFIGWAVFKTDRDIHLGHSNYVHLLEAENL